MKTIARNRKKALAAIFSQASDFRVYCLDNGFSGELMTPDTGIAAALLQKELRDFSFCKLVHKGAGSYMLKVHSNLWYEFTSKVIEA